MKPVFLSVLFSVFSTAALAGEALSLTAVETHRMVQESADEMLFIDVRDPVEIMFVGFTDSVDRNIPFTLVDRHDFSDEDSRFAMNTNADFVAGVEAALQRKGLDKTALIVTMCRSGSARGKPSAEYLTRHGFSNVKYVAKGFQGDQSAEGAQEGRRVVNGWVNSGLPWSYDINPEKIYRP